MKNFLFFSLLLIFLLSIQTSQSVWISDVLQIQRTLGKDLPWNMVGSPRSVNTYNSVSQGNSAIFATQFLTLSQQLDLGIRRIQLDVHNVTQLNFSILVCPGSLTNENYCNNSLGWSGCNSVGIQDYGNSTGCLSTSPTFANYVQQIKNWLDSNPGEFIFLDLNVYSQVSTEALTSVMVSVFGNSLLNASEASILFPTTPIPTLQQLVNANKSITYFGTLGGLAEQMYPTSPFNYVSYFQPFPICRSYQAPVLPSGYNGDFYADDLFLPGFYNGPSTTGNMTAQVIQDLNDCGFWIGLENINEAMLNNTAWSFEQGRPTLSTVLNCALFDNTTLFWRDEDCSLFFYAACQNVSNNLDWVLSSSSSTWYNANTSCPTGYVFSVPATGLENKYLKNVLSTSNTTAVWLNFNDIITEGVWTRVWNGIFNVTTGLQTTNMLVFVTVDIGGTTLINGTIPVTTGGGLIGTAASFLSTNWFILTIVGAIIVAVILCIISVICVRKKRKNRDSDQTLYRQRSFFEMN